jgi:hypothetical protein
MIEKITTKSSTSFLDIASQFQFIRQYGAIPTEHLFLDDIGRFGSLLLKISLQELYATMWLMLALPLDEDNVVMPLVYTQNMYNFIVILNSQELPHLLAIPEGE